MKKTTLLDYNENRVSDTRTFLETNRHLSPLTYREKILTTYGPHAKKSEAVKAAVNEAVLLYLSKG